MEKQEYENIFLSEDSHWWYSGMRSIFFSLASKYLRAGMKILDTGCGTGKNAQILAKYGCVVAFDISGDALKFAKKRGAGNLVRASANFLPFKKDSFDFITSFDVIYHKQVDDSLAVKEMSRVCSTGGFVFIRAPALKSLMRPHDIIVHTKKRFNLNDMAVLLKDAKLSAIKLTYANFFLLPAVYFQKNSSGSDIKNAGALENLALGSVLKFESFLLKYINFPIGVSLISLAQKP